MFHRGFKHSKTIKALGLRPRAFISFLVFETPMKHSHSFLKYFTKNKIPDDPTKTMGLYSLVSVATAAKYDLTANIDVTDGLTNGAECVIENIDYRVENSTRPSIIWVSFPHPDIGKNMRRHC